MGSAVTLGPKVTLQGPRHAAASTTAPLEQAPPVSAEECCGGWTWLSTPSAPNSFSCHPLAMGLSPCPSHEPDYVPLLLKTSPSLWHRPRPLPCLLCPRQLTPYHIIAPFFFPPARPSYSCPLNNAVLNRTGPLPRDFVSIKYCTSIFLFLMTFLISFSLAYFIARMQYININTKYGLSTIYVISKVYGQQ